MKTEIKVTLLSGGTGTPKLILGLREFIKDEYMTIIGNTGDDDEFYGLLISPDIDTLIYLFSNQLDLEKFWGVKNESFNTLNQLQNLNEETWFKLGDKDLGLHLLRNRLLFEGWTITDIVKEISKRLEINAKILPMSNDSVRTILQDHEGTKYSFQRYTVKSKERPIISEVDYDGADKASIKQEVKEAISHASTIIIGPSNPITSIGPMLAIKGLKDELKETSAKIIAISPIEEGSAFSGPAAKLLKQLNYIPNAYGIAILYKEFLDVMIISEKDKELQPEIEKLGIDVYCMNISLRTPLERKLFAKKLLDLITKKQL